ncbi:hypothetical protein [Hymenobacter cellulosilyticus]|uniref:CBM-cenC domain-containing protein n=1 Tax=Hymenobacter cellulosilyticus TaxID=2932248 RepID=A0A8T9Q7F2_9BACT|nr:hypothetical protein [Hymenobacter cellulosilyticus]UOQ73507.1 hypothetical protein MUN79_06105 [Hymenobacter cellulosilyticus]
MKAYIGLLGLALLGACSSDKDTDLKIDDKTITTNDFESLAGWNTDPTTLDKGRAHSGQYAIIVDGNREFSVTYNAPLAQISNRKFKKVLLEGWVFLPSERATGVLGIQIVDAETGKEAFGDGIKLGDEVKTYKKWVPVKKEFTLPDNITAVQHMKMSLWRASASDFILADDVKISIVE